MLFRIGSMISKPKNATLGFRENISRLLNTTNEIRKFDKYGSQWYLMGETEEEAYQYIAIDENNNFTAAAEAVLNTRFKNEKESKYFSAWNGELEHENGASITLHFNINEWPNWMLEVEYPNETVFERLGKISGLVRIITAISIDLRPNFVTAYAMSYDDAKVFKDRPGVGWMLYLPQTLTAKQVPEAAELIPVTDGDNKQIGTIIVSTTEEFSDENPEHVKRANAIEIRLVDQDLLPRYMDLK